jgi:hypothetical protein
MILSFFTLPRLRTPNRRRRHITSPKTFLRPRTRRNHRLPQRQHPGLLARRLRRSRARRSTHPAHRTNLPARRCRHVQSFRTTRDQVLAETGNMDALGGVIVGSRDDFDDFVAWELEGRYVGGAACHQVAVEDA